VARRQVLEGAGLPQPDVRAYFSRLAFVAIAVQQTSVVWYFPAGDDVGVSL